MATQLSFLVLLAGCSFFTTTPVPGYLPYLVADFDLDGTLPEEIETVEASPVTTDEEAYVALFARSASLQNSPDFLLLYDSSFNPRYSQAYGPNQGVPFNQPLVNSAIATAGDEGEQLIVGNIRFIPRTGNAEVTNGATPARSVFSGIQVDEAYYTVRVGDQSNTVIVEPYTTAFLLNEVNAREVSLAPDASALTGDVHGHTFRGEDGERQLVVTVGLTGHRLLVITIPAAQLPTLAQPLSDNYPSVTIRGNAPRYTYRIRQGIVTADTDRHLFRRFDPDSGTQIDRFAPGSDGEEFFDDTIPAFFMNSGNYLLLDTSRRRLYEVAPWW